MYLGGSHGGRTGILNQGIWHHSCAFSHYAIQDLKQMKREDSQASSLFINVPIHAKKFSSQIYIEASINSLL